ncbi:MAG: peptide chain release factor N(5)-glutamine methyltransferase [Pseudomonadales bacterium]
MNVTLAGWLARHTGLPRLDRELLLCHHLQLNRAVLIASPERPVDPARLEQLDRDAGRLAAGEPLAYLTGERGFWDFTLKVTPDVLIPRPETETLVEAALARLHPGDRVVDLGTGSGAIAIALARSAGAAVVAVDISPAALTVARENAARLKAAVTFVEGDWLAGLEGRFRMIVANPPYVADGDPHLDALTHEPARALLGGADGLDALRRIVRQSPHYLEPGGWLLLEHGYDQAEAVGNLLAAAGFADIALVRDLGGQPRVTLGRLGADHGAD